MPGSLVEEILFSVSTADRQIFTTLKGRSRAKAMDPRLREQISRLEVMLSGQGPIPPRDSQSWDNAVALGKVIINSLESPARARSSLGVPRWVNFVGLLQKLAYVEPDEEAQPDIAAWSERQWTEVLQSHPHNVPALQGKSKPKVLTYIF